MRPITPSTRNITQWWLFEPNSRLVSINLICRYFRFHRDGQPGPLGITPDLMIQSFQLGCKNAKRTGRLQLYDAITLGREWLNASLDNQLFLRPIGNGNFRGLRRQRRNLNRSILGNCATRETRVAHLKLLSVAILALLQYVSRGQKSLERFRIQNGGARRNGWDALHVYE